MNCPICHVSLKRSEIESTDIFACPYCHKFLRRVEPDPVLKFLGLVGAIAGLLVLIGGILGHSRLIRDFGGLLAFLGWFIELVRMALRKQRASNELEPAEPASRYK